MVPSQGWGEVLMEQHGRRSPWVPCAQHGLKPALKGPDGSEKRTQARATTEVEETGLGDKCETGG